MGGLDRGIVGLMDLNLVVAIFGGGSAISRMIYILLGLAALYTIYSAARDSP